MRTRALMPTPTQAYDRAWGLAPDASGPESSPGRAPAASRIGHHFSGVAMIQRQQDEEPEPKAPTTPAPDVAEPDATAPDPAAPLSAKSDANGETIVQEPVVIYDSYSAPTLTDLVSIMPQEPGSAEFEISASTEGDPVTKASVTVTQEVHLPKWVERDKRCKEEQKAWDAFSSAMVIHEDGHIAINRAKFDSAHSKFKGKSSGATQAVTDQIKRAAKAAGKVYDDKTQHGVTGTPPTIIDLTNTCATKKTSDSGVSGEEETLMAKLDVSQPGDPYELEADRVADHVMRMADPYSSGWGISAAQGRLQRKCTECEEEEKDAHTDDADEEDDKRKRSATGPLQRKEDGPGSAASGQAVAATRTLGQPLDAQTRAFMEPRFGFDFSHVRIHADSHAATAARSINARAYTLGDDIVFATGRYTPGSSEGRRLLAHELTHVAQQTGGVPLTALVSPPPARRKRAM